jgi:flagellar biosynthesis/type III secretory pathway chaperone
MSSPATIPSNPDISLRTVLLDVHATLTALLAAADDQYAAIAAGDHSRLEDVTSRQERLSAQLQRCERKRVELLAGTSLSEAITQLPGGAELYDAIGTAVRDLELRHKRASSLLERSIGLTSQTLAFLQRLVTPQLLAYGPAGLARPNQSLLVDSRA